MTEPVIASAVVLPDPVPGPETTPSSPTLSSLKRSATDNEDESESLKRQKISADPVGVPDQDTNGVGAKDQAQDQAPRSTSPKRRQPAIDERKRTRRLFGNLLGTLSQKPTDSAASRRRAEFEARKRDETQARDAELEVRQKERAAGLLKIRRVQQRRVDEENLRLRHENEISMAGFLRTETEPRIFWRPWEMSEEQEEIVRQQKDKTEGKVEREVEDFEAQKRKWREEADERDAIEHRNGGDDEERETVIVTENTATAEMNGVHQDADGSYATQNGINGNRVDTNMDEGKEGNDRESDEAATSVPQPEKPEQHHNESENMNEDKARKGSPEEGADTMEDAGEDTVMY